jgi:hypothetical protein
LLLPKFVIDALFLERTFLGYFFPGINLNLSNYSEIEFGELNPSGSGSFVKFT